jgi:monovalent cation:H+ antiporter-2, CPA2 family
MSQRLLGHVNHLSLQSNMPTLDTALIYLLFAVIGVVACRLLQLPAMLGYLVAGIFSRQGGALVHENEVLWHLWPSSVWCCLMFVIGLEFNLPKSCA